MEEEAQDIKRLREAGIHTVEALFMQTKKAAAATTQQQPPASSPPSPLSPCVSLCCAAARG
jgi:hypothetical protein